MDRRERREKLKKLADLRDIHVQVMYYRCLDYTVAQIADKLNIEPSTAWSRSTRIYELLGITGDDKEGELVKQYSPFLLEFVKSEEDLNKWGRIRAEILRQSQAVQSQSETVSSSDSATPSQSEKSSSDDIDSQNQLKSSSATSSTTETQKSPEMNQGDRPLWFLIAIPLLIVCLLCVSGALIGWRFLEPIFANARNPAQPTQTISSVPVIASQTSLPTSTFTALPITTIAPTITATITETPSPTPSVTSAPYYSEKEAVEIKPGVFLSINPEFGNPNYVLCWAPKPGYSLKFDITNNSSDEFLMRFNWYEFRVEDDLGREYEVKEAGINACSSDPGLRSLILGSNSATRIFVTFAGEIGTDAKYLLVTVENISGYGPFVFRKDF